MLKMTCGRKVRCRLVMEVSREGVFRNAQLSTSAKLAI